MTDGKSVKIMKIPSGILPTVSLYTHCIGLSMAFWKYFSEKGIFLPFCHICLFLNSVFGTKHPVFPQINIPPYNGGYFSFGHSPNITGNAQARLLLACQPRIYYVHPAQAGLNPSLPCVKGGGTACRDGGIVKPAFQAKTIPQSASLTAPFTQGSLPRKSILR